VVANFALFFLGLGFTGLGAVNPGTAPLWFGLAALVMGIAILRTMPVRTRLGAVLGRAANALAVAPMQAPNAEALDTVRQERDAARRERDELQDDLRQLRAERAAEIAAAVSEEKELVRADFLARLEAARSPRSAWLPDPTDLTTSTLTVDALDKAFERAETAAAEKIGPDPRFDFDYLMMGPEGGARLSYRAESKTADKHATVLVDAETVAMGTSKRGGISIGHTQAGEPYSAWIKDSAPLYVRTPTPWRDHRELFDLIRLAGFRLRPLRQDVKFECWNRWRVEVPRPDDISVGRNVDLYVVEDGELAPWKGDIDGP
jgi:hypothetical protein